MLSGQRLSEARRAAWQSQQRPPDCMHAPELGWSCRAALTDPWLQHPPGRGHALGGDTTVKPLQSNTLATGETLTLTLKGGWVMHHDWCPVTSPPGRQVG